MDDACDRIWPPIGLSAPPATKVIVAPGSATIQTSYGERQAHAYTCKMFALTLHLVCQKNSDLHWDLTLALNKSAMTYVILLPQLRQPGQQLCELTDLQPRTMGR